MEDGARPRLRPPHLQPVAAADRLVDKWPKGLQRFRLLRRLSTGPERRATYPRVAGSDITPEDWS